MVSPGARCLNFVSPECVRRGEECSPAQVINFSCSLSRKIDGEEASRTRKVLVAKLLATGDGRKREQIASLRVTVVVVEGSKWAEAWQTAKRIKYGSTTKAVSQGRSSHKSPSSATHPVPLTSCYHDSAPPQRQPLI